MEQRPRNEKGPAARRRLTLFVVFGRDGRIRTFDPLHPMQFPHGYARTLANLLRGLYHSKHAAFRPLFCLHQSAGIRRQPADLVGQKWGKIIKPQILQGVGHDQADG